MYKNHVNSPRAQRRYIKEKIMKNDNTHEVGKVYETYDYELFVKVKGNRAINQAHVNRLAKKMERRFLKELPIIVGPKNKDGKHPILDGQHSGDSRQAKGLPIRYIVTKRTTYLV